MTNQHTILHADIDAFFASVEQLHNPRLRGKPVIVGAGVIASCSYEARRLGLHAGMPLGRARELCPEAVVVNGDRHVYGPYAAMVFETLRRFVPDVASSLDEAYGSLRGIPLGPAGGQGFGERVRDAVARRTGLSVTVGVGPSLMAAKIAGKTVKPGGVRAVTREELARLLTDMAVDVIPGVGWRTRKTLAEFNVRTVADLRVLPRDALVRVFGARGSQLYDLCRGLDTRPGPGSELPRTISRETSFHTPTSDRREIEGMLFYLCERAVKAARDAGLTARTVAVRIRYADLRGDGARSTLARPTERDDEVYRAALALLSRLYRRRANLRLVGVVLSGLARRAEGLQLDLFAGRDAQGRHALYRALDEIRDRWGHSALVAGRSLHLLGRLGQDEHGFVLRTPCLTK